MDENKNSPLQKIIDNKEYIYPLMFYAAGLIIASFGYRIISNSAISALIQNVFSNKQAQFVSLFLNRFSVYMSLYVVCVFLGMCLVGFPFINVIMTIIGAELAIKTAYYYINYSAKGIGFALLMIIPEGAAIGTVLIFAIKTSNELSRQIFEIAAKNNNSGAVEIKYFLKKYIVFALIVLLITLVNALVSYFLSGIISI